MTGHDTLYTYADLEELFQLTRDAIRRRFVKTGRLLPVRFSHKCVRFRSQDVQKLIDEALSVEAER